MFGLGAPELLILLVAVIPLVITIAAFVSVVTTPDEAFQRANTSKTTWIVCLVLGIFLCQLFGLVTAIVWFASARSRVVAA